MRYTPSVLAFCFLVSGVSCSSQESADRPTTVAPTTSTTVPPSTAAQTVPEATATTVVEATTTVPAGLELLSATYVCGPADGPWIEVVVLSPLGRTVFAEVTVVRQPYGRSGPVLLRPAVQETIGFDPGTPREAFGSTAVVQIVASDDPASPIASGDVLLKLPASMSCG